MRDRGTNPGDPSVPVGRRVQIFRERRGMSRAVLGGLVGRSERWVRALESGQLKQPSIQTLGLIAEALRLADLGQLVSGVVLPVDQLRGPGHSALSAVRDAVNSVRVADEPPQPLAHLQARVDAAWRARHAAPDHRTVLGALLPDLVQDAKTATRAYEGPDRRRALAILTQVYNLTQFYVAYQPDAGLLWRVAERALMAAQESGDPHAFGCAVWLMAQAHRDDGRFEAAEQVGREALEAIEPHLPDGAEPLRAIYGALEYEMAYTAARAGSSGTAWHWWDRSDRTARTLPASYYDPMTSYSRVIMTAHAVTTAVELRQSGEAVRQAQRAASTTIPSRPRSGRHLIEVARAHHLADDHAATLHSLDVAQAAAPETIRYNGYARRLIVELADTPATRAGARALADRVGVAV